jgi:hypothetical protein
VTVAHTVEASAEHLLPLPGSDWSLWRTFVVRGAGMPFSWSEQFDERVKDPLVREAMLWQNPDAARQILRTESRRWWKRRVVFASYLERYTTKNDTIGFFGPVGWGTWVDGPTAVAAGAGLTRRRTVRFERWAIDELARALDRRHGLRTWVAPVRAPSVAVHGGHVYLGAAPRRLDPLLGRVFRLVDGSRSARELAFELIVEGMSEHDVFAALEQLQSLGAITWEFGATKRSPDPERRLRGQLLRVGDTSRRDAALADLDRLEAGRARVAEAAGDPDALAAALAELQQTFEVLTGTPAMRRPGELYAGRLVLYEDTVRDATVDLDVSLAERLGPPLGLLLDSARWLACAVEEAHHAEALAAHARFGGGSVPLAWLLDELFGSVSGNVTSLVAPIAAELQRRWTEILAPVSGERVLQRRAEELADAVAQSFPSERPGWTAARYHCPDILVAADGVEALAAGACLFVVGELHVALNTIDAPCLVAQHDRPDRLLAALERDVPGRILPLFARDVGNSRTYPPTALQSPEFTYLGVGADPPDCPDGATLLPLFGLVAVVEDGRLRVRARGDDGPDLPWSEVVGEYLSITCVKAFGLLEPAPHTPRVVVDDVVFARESWRFPLEGTPLARRDRGPARNAAVREWAGAEGLPRRVFLTLPGSGKPQYLDVRSELSVDVAARFVRRAIDRGLEGDVLASEMLPGPDGLWLLDAQGRRYTCELRMVCVDPGCPRP